jgi:hypothetical protein
MKRRIVMVMKEKQLNLLKKEFHKYGKPVGAQQVMDDPNLLVSISGTNSINQIMELTQ